MELKETLLMPKTPFEMRGNLGIKEPNYVKMWHDIDLYALMLDRNKGKKHFILHDGPPYANGNIHAGHMLNRTLKDFVVRFKNMQGFDTPFILGWDTHGLPIENQVTKSGIDRKAMPTSEFRQLCEDYALKQVDLQKEQIKRLGVVGDYDHAYITLTKDYEATQLGVFKDLALKGLIYRGAKPVYWSPSSESALAEAEIEYHDVVSDAIYVSFDVTQGNEFVAKGDKFIIWTTTPWTLPANLAISVHPYFEYGLYASKIGNVVLLQDLVEQVSKALNLEFTLLKTFKGQALEYIETKHPLFDRVSLVIVGEHVTAEAGTGAVHTAPGHGVEDFIVGQKYNLEVLCPVDERGIMTSEAGVYAGEFYEKANVRILEDLAKVHALLDHKKFTHSYPHDWRTNKPLIFRATPQWFASIKPIKEQLLDEVKKVVWYPSWGEQRITNMITDRADWCISRQRVWGVPIPIIYEEDGSPIMDEKVFDHIISQVAKHGSNIWFDQDAKFFLPKGYTSKLSPNGNYTKETDIMDVWFDSGSSALHVLAKHHLPFPADLYLEGNDQYRGWFNSSLTLSVASKGISPYKSVVTHGFIVDEKGNKMSKSKGNVLDPLKLSNNFGADVLRLWAASIDYQTDARLSQELIKQTSETYRKIRNTFKFMLGNLPPIDEVADLKKALATKEVALVDGFILAKLQEVINKAVASFEHYDFSNALSVITNFITNDLSSFYLDITKDILYCEAKDSLRRNQVVKTIYMAADALLRLLAPILVFTSEEIYQNFPVIDRVASVQLLDLPTVSPSNIETLKQYNAFIKLRDEALFKLEEERKKGVIGSSQEARLTLAVSNEHLAKLLKDLDQAELARLFIVSDVEFGQITKVSKHHDQKCERCWNYRETQVKDGHNICARCLEVIKTYE